MATSLVIVESPAKARTIKRFLGSRYTVKATMGHLRDLPRSQFGVDVENNYEPKYITIRGKGSILQELKKTAKKSARVLLATDPDREGEAIAWHVAQALELDGEKCRVEFREITKQAVVNAIKNPRHISENLVAAQQGRRVLDRIVGYKLSPLLWAKVKRGLSAGRVQSVAVRLICDREAEIEGFVPEEYWSVIGVLQTLAGSKFEAKLVKWNNKKIELKTEADAVRVREDIEGLPWVVTKVSRKDRKRHPSPPFTTSTLQQEAARKLNFAPRKTMRLAQQLYEGLDIGKEGTVGLITYMRTDAVRVADEALNEARRLIEEIYGKPYVPAKPNFYKSKSQAQDAHEAIRPTDVWRTPDSLKTYLNRDQLRLYRLIWERFVASQTESAVIDSVSADIQVDGYTFRATGSQLKFPGFIKIYIEGSDDKEEQTGMLPELAEGEAVACQELQLNQHFTQPPPRYTEAMLVKALEEKGIGRPSTFAPTIDTIQHRGYVVLTEKRFVPTELGRVVIDILKENFAELIDVDFTASMEQKLDEIEAGRAEWIEVIDHFYQEFVQLLDKANRNLEKIDLPDEVSDQQCDKCGSYMVVKHGRFGKFLACPNYPECKNTKPLLKTIGIPCSYCKDGEIVERRTKKGRVFYGCSNYPDCEFTSWYRPVQEKCPSCGHNLVIKTRKSRPVCSNKACPGKDGE
ncbi:MAG: type I DNA topoisomerase [Firmicutes bacterium]|nr:type I DNA topoisomerase [Bacillota bacterium]